MSIDKFKRVLWRLREMETKAPGLYTNKQIRLAIIGAFSVNVKNITLSYICVLIHPF